MDRKERLLAGINQSVSVCAEIGALSHPILEPTMPHVRFIDYTDTETLRKNYAKDPYVEVGKIVEVSAIWGDNTLPEALGGKVDHIIASHVIEHVPDLLTWLDELYASLNDGGSVRLAIPDKRFTFDYLRQETRLSDVIQSHLIRARIPQPQYVLDFHLNAVKVDCASAWDGILNALSFQHFNTPDEAINAARDVIDNGAYRDVHCWVFTPRSFGELMIELARAGLIGFACETFHDTEKYTFEFFVKMVPCDDSQRLIASWQAMVDMAFDYSSAKKDAMKAKEVAGEYGDISALLCDANKEIFDLSSEVGELRSKVTDLLTHIHAMEQSRSWRLTEPLRRAVRRIRR
jgi:hypothetical protein